MAGLDLSGVAAAIDALLLVDELQITRPSAGQGELDPDTLLITPSSPAEVWTGLGAIQPLTGYTALEDPDMRRIVETTNARHRALLSVGQADSAQVDDILTCHAVHSKPGDPQLSGAVFRVVDFGGVSSFSVLRIIYLEQTGRLDDPTPAPRVPVTYEGHGAPPDDLAWLVGDYYLDLDTGDLYENQE